MMTFVSIIIPVADDAEGLSVTLWSLRTLIDHDGFEILICNDGGEDAITELAHRHGCREVRLDQNMGSYAARNQGVDASQGSILAFLDADQRVDPRWLTAGLAALEHADYVGGRIVIDSSEATDRWREYDVLTAFPVDRYLRDTHFAPTANLFIRRQVVEQIGVFNAGLRSGGDREFGKRVYEAGLRQAYCEESITFHPARGRNEQLAKRRRTGSGMAEVRLLAWGQPRWLVASYGLFKLLTVPWEVLRNAFVFKGSLWTRLRLLSIDALLHLTFQVAFLRRALLGLRRESLIEMEQETSSKAGTGAAMR